MGCRRTGIWDLWLRCVTVETGLGCRAFELVASRVGTEGFRAINLGASKHELESQVCNTGPFFNPLTRLLFRHCG